MKTFLITKFFEFMGVLEAISINLQEPTYSSLRNSGLTISKSSWLMQSIIHTAAATPHKIMLLKILWQVPTPFMTKFKRFSMAYDGGSDDESLSLMPDSLWPHGLQPTKLLYPWNSPGNRLEWVATFFSKGSSWSRDRTQVSCIAGRFFTVWATREAQHGL